MCKKAHSHKVTIARDSRAPVSSPYLGITTGSSSQQLTREVGSIFLQHKNPPSQRHVHSLSYLDTLYRMPHTQVLFVCMCANTCIGKHAHMGECIYVNLSVETGGPHKVWAQLLSALRFEAGTLTAPAAC